MLIKTVLLRFFRGVDREGALLLEKSTSLVSSIVNGALLAATWLFLPLENANWRALRARFSDLYSNVDPTRTRPLDGLRILIQSLFLLFVRGERISRPTPIKKKKRALPAKLLYRTTVSLKAWDRREAERFAEIEPQPIGLTRAILYTLLGAVTVVLFALCVTQHLDPRFQVIFSACTFALALVLRLVRIRLTVLLLVLLSLVVSSRYLWWRLTETVNFDSISGHFFSALLMTAEIYTFVLMALSYFQTFWVLDRKPCPLPENRSLWPHVDVCIPSYNEPLELVRTTVLGVQSMDWPEEKLHVWILDDGDRDDFQAFAKETGVGYIRREEHKGAKAGNINHALGKIHGEFVVIFDCDHIPVRSFLTNTMGWMLRDRKIALVQTPHHFYSPAPYQRNLRLTDAVPQEDALFHVFIQRGNDTWNATLFCGSCTVIRREALDEIGGIATETVTEDAHTSLRLYRRGWRSAFISTPLAAGLSTETLASHIGQRIRWARGMIQIFRLDNPLFGRGLSLGQRLCFFSGMFYFLLGIPRIVFLIAPLPFVFFDANVIQAPGLAILAFVVPHLVHLNLSNEFAQRGLRFPLMGEIYDTVLSWYIAIPTTVALFAPHVGKFNVTTKGGQVDSDHLDWHIARPYLVLLALNAAGLLWLFGRAFSSAGIDGATILVNAVWLLYNMVILSAAVAVAVETVQERRFHRVTTRHPASLRRDDGTVWHATLLDFSQTGVNLEMPAEAAGLFSAPETVSLVLEDEGVPCEFRGIIRRANARGVGIELTFRSLSEEKRYIAATFCRDHLWDDALHKPGVGIGEALRAILSFAGLGIRSIISLAPPWVAIGLVDVQRFLRWVSDFFPRRPRRREF